MYYTDTLISEYTDPTLRTAFRQYFAELGCHVTNWAGLFAGMDDAHREHTWTQRNETGRITAFSAWMNEDARNFAWVRRNESGNVVAFIQFTIMDMGSWFFRAKCGFIREFWVTEPLRRHGHGGELLQKAEEWLGAQECVCILLTTDTAPGFYRRHGYSQYKGIEARNTEPVFAKILK